MAGINQTLQGLLSIIAPPLAALLVAALPLHGLLAIDAATAAAGIAPLFFIRVPEPRRAVANDARVASVGQDFVAGLRYLRGGPGLLIVMGLAAAINFLVQPAMTLVPILVTQYFGGTASQLATLQTAFGVGLMLGGALLAVWGGARLSFLAMGPTPATAFGAALPAILGAPAWYIASRVVTLALAGLAWFLPPVVGLDAPPVMAGAERQPS